MKRQVVALSLLAALLTACGTDDGGGGGEESGTTPPTTSAPATSPPARTTSAAPQGKGTQPPIESGDWRLDSITVRDNGLGDFGGRARITYTGDNPDGGLNTFTITVFKGGKDVASLEGSASDVQPGRTITADLISTDKFVSGPYTYDFQKDF
ncbi:hypothetical protein [Streptomyces sp. H27-D2]|uniref:hypothetical protein n=1 Tax=Streptomyces sp. H27-D2 TaxID=3046304 RepID=UPI002DB6CA44|nr:hypothetical protein [Streptomyces sp. H27-D2]MEC4019801.1 hypothetical protein [Streptomyces sp. H27-D2]